ncbi:MAG: hypothetical protein JO301_11305 [Chitinophagaceae bacterium]|nr:hypothetical protein [Chitinophagaceae bacterium]
MPKPAPYDFVLDHLPKRIVVKAQFGMHYVYLDKKLVLMLRKTDKPDGLNGIFVATLKKHHQSLQQEIPALSPFALDTGEDYDSHWRFLKESHDDFETAAIGLCELISRGDPRIGKLTKGGALL